MVAVWCFALPRCRVWRSWKWMGGECSLVWIVFVGFGCGTSWFLVLVLVLFYLNDDLILFSWVCT